MIWSFCGFYNAIHVGICGRNFSWQSFFKRGGNVAINQRHTSDDCIRADSTIFLCSEKDVLIFTNFN